MADLVAVPQFLREVERRPRVERGEKMLAMCSCAEGWGERVNERKMR
jgi:hypothetical protein